VGYSPEEQQIFDKVQESDLRACLLSLREAVEATWPPDAPLLVSDFTDHGPKHYARIAKYANQILQVNSSSQLSSEEAFLLLAAINLHDVGMQCDVTTAAGQAILKKAKALGAKPKVVFRSKSASNYSDVEKKAIRANHHYLSSAWIQQARNMSGSGITEAAKCIPYYLVSALSNICLYHTKLSIVQFRSQKSGSANSRVRLVAAILRLADELDISGDRVRIEAAEQFGLPPDNGLYWWLHHLTRVSFTGPNVFGVVVSLNDADYTRLGSTVQSFYLDHLRHKNDETLAVLKEFGYTVALDVSGGVVIDPAAPRIPPEIRSALERLGEKRVEIEGIKSSVPKPEIKTARERTTPKLGTRDVVLVSCSFQKRTEATEYGRPAGLARLLADKRLSDEVFAQRRQIRELLQTGRLEDVEHNQGNRAARHQNMNLVLGPDFGDEHRERRYLPAFWRYSGRGYRLSKSEWREFFRRPESERPSLLIVSGLYGILKAEESIQDYDCHLADADNVTGRDVRQYWSAHLTRVLLSHCEWLEEAGWQVGRIYDLLSEASYQCAIDWAAVQSSFSVMHRVFENNAGLDALENLGLFIRRIVNDPSLLRTLETNTFYEYDEFGGSDRIAFEDVVGSSTLPVTPECGPQHDLFGRGS
jgi:hypothetical protein